MEFVGKDDVDWEDYARKCQTDENSLKETNPNATFGSVCFFYLVTPNTPARLSETMYWKKPGTIDDSELRTNMLKRARSVAFPEPEPA